MKNYIWIRGGSGILVRSPSSLAAQMSIGKKENNVKSNIGLFAHVVTTSQAELALPTFLIHVLGLGEFVDMLKIRNSHRHQSSILRKIVITKVRMSM